MSSQWPQHVRFQFKAKCFPQSQPRAKSHVTLFGILHRAAIRDRQRRKKRTFNSFLLFPKDKLLGFFIAAFFALREIIPSGTKFNFMVRFKRLLQIQEFRLLLRHFASKKFMQFSSEMRSDGETLYTISRRGIMFPNKIPKPLQESEVSKYNCNQTINVTHPTCFQS